MRPVEDVQMGFEHVLRQGIAEFLIAVVEGDAEAVFGEIWQGLMYCECGKDQGVADFVVCAVPLAFPIRRCGCTGCPRRGRSGVP